jgi:hypothetical protein
LWQNQFWELRRFHEGCCLHGTDDTIASCVSLSEEEMASSPI